MRVTFVLWCLSMLVAAISRAEIGIGDNRDEVLRQIGKPTSTARRGDHEIFVYPKGGRIEFVAGKVTDVKGPLPTPAAPSLAPLSLPPPVAEPSVPTSKTDAPVKPAPIQKAPAPKVFSNDEYNPPAAANELAKHVEKMDSPWGMAPQRQEVHSPLDALPSFLTGLAMRFVFTVIALKLAFKYWEMDAFWTGVFLIAGIDLTLHALLEILGPMTGGFTTLIAVENGIPGLVLIYTIHRFCFNKRIQNAVITAAAVKLVVTLCYVFAGIATLNMIYG